MKPAKIRESIKARSLQLTGLAKYTYFEPAIWSGFITVLLPGFLLYDWLVYGEFQFSDFLPTAFLIFTLLPAILAVILYNRQIRALKLKKIDTKRNREEIIAAIIELAEYNNWEVRNKTKTYLLLKTHPSLWSGSWGEQITILFDKDRVWLNSICDPDKRTSIVSMGRNRKNMFALIVAVKSPSKIT